MDYTEFWSGIKDGLKGDYYENNSIKSYPEYGDIICIDTGPIYHYGIYENDTSVVHFAPINKEEIKLKNIIQQAENAEIHIVSLNEFLSNKREFFICNCPKIPVIFTTIPDPVTSRAYKLYTPKETIERAYEKIGKNDYDLFENNCETFAFWCKTGIRESLQMLNILKGVRMDRVNI